MSKQSKGTKNKIRPVLRKIVTTETHRDMLKSVSEPIDNPDNPDKWVRSLMLDIRKTAYNLNAEGLAAVQTGQPLRILGFRLEKGIIVLSNPEIVNKSDKTDKRRERCLSLPGRQKTVKRPLTVYVKGYTPYGKLLNLTLSGMSARAFCHEMDHLEGILITDYKEEDEEQGNSGFR